MIRRFHVYTASGYYELELWLRRMAEEPLPFDTPYHSSRELEVHGLTVDRDGCLTVIISRLEDEGE